MWDDFFWGVGGGVDKQFHPRLYWVCDYLSMLWLMWMLLDDHTKEFAVLHYICTISCNRKYKDYVYRKMLVQEYLKN